MRQEVTRAHKGWALDTVTIHNEVLKQVKEEITAAPQVCLAEAELGRPWMQIPSYLYLTPFPNNNDIVIVTSLWNKLPANCHSSQSLGH